MRREKARQPVTLLVAESRSFRLEQPQRREHGRTTKRGQLGRSGLTRGKGVVAETRKQRTDDGERGGVRLNFGKERVHVGGAGAEGVFAREQAQRRYEVLVDGSGVLRVEPEQR